MLLRSQSHGSGCSFTKAQKLAQIVTKSTQFLVFFFRDTSRRALFHSNHLSLLRGAGILKSTHKAMQKRRYGEEAILPPKIRESQILICRAIMQSRIAG